MISNNDNIVIADISNKKLIEVNNYLKTNNLTVNLIGGWTEDINDKSALISNNNFQLFDNSLDFFKNYRSNDNPVTVVFISHIDKCESALKEILTYDNINIKSFLLVTIATTNYKMALIKNMCKKITAEINFISLDTQSAYKILNSDDIIWTYDELDEDIKNELEERKINTGKFLDVGAGLCTQSYYLAKIGFEVIAMDYSSEALEVAKSKIKDVELEYVVDNVLDPKFNDEVDYILDRGCLHCFKVSDRPKYTETIRKILRPNGILFLKAFDKRGSVHSGPMLFSKLEVIDLFSDGFKVEKIVDSFITDNTGNRIESIFAVIRRV